MDMFGSKNGDDCVEGNPAFALVVGVVVVGGSTGKTQDCWLLLGGAGITRMKDVTFR
jgi:hypothetical protein